MKDITTSLEDYVEAIYMVIKQNRVARSKDIKERLGVNGASVTAALKLLSDNGLVNYKPYEFITLTAKGKEIGKIISRRHFILKNFLVTILEQEEERAENMACVIEHCMTPDSTMHITALLDFFKNNPKTHNDFKNYYESFKAGNRDNCCRGDEL